MTHFPNHVYILLFPRLRFLFASFHFLFSAASYLIFFFLHFWFSRSQFHSREGIFLTAFNSFILFSLPLVSSWADSFLSHIWFLISQFEPKFFSPSFSIFSTHFWIDISRSCLILLVKYCPWLDVIIISHVERSASLDILFVWGCDEVAFWYLYLVLMHLFCSHTACPAGRVSQEL